MLPHSDSNIYLLQIYIHLLIHQCSFLLALQSYQKVAHTTGDPTNMEMEELTAMIFHSVIHKVIVGLCNCIVKSGIKVSNASKQLFLSFVEITNAPDAFLIQGKFLQFLKCSLRYIAFPWLKVANLKKAETLIRHVLLTFKSYHLRHKVLANDLPWNFHMVLNSIINNWLANKGMKGTWSWFDRWNEQPKLSYFESTLDKIHGPLQLHNRETLGNQSIQL